MIVKTARYQYTKTIFFVLTTFLLVIGFTTFLVKKKNFPTHAYSSDLFVTSWTTNVEGATEPTKVTLNFLKNATDEYEVSWHCNDDFLPVSSNKVSYDYGEAGTYDICVRSTAPLHFYAPDLAVDERAKLQEIKQWGHIPWSSFSSAFQGMVNMQLTASDIPNLSAVTDMSSAFEGATNFTGNSYMNNWVTSNVTNMNSMFKDATNFNSPIGGWNTSQVKNMASMFRDARSFNQYIGGWNTGAVTNMSYMFNGATNFNNGEAPGESHNTMNWDTKNVGDMTYMFQGASAFNQKIGDWNTGNVGYMSGMFFNAAAFNNGEAPGESHNTINWSSAKLQYMIYMFYGAEAFNQPFGDNWNTASVKNMGYAFRDAKSFNQDIGNWNTANVENMAHIFRGASAFNQNLSNWQTGNVTDMSDMFNEATNFNNGDEPGGSSNSLNNWDTSKVKSMFRMFRYASAFNQNLSNWQTGNVTDMSNMFNEATNFNNGEAPSESHNTMNWDTKNVGDMTYMFYKAGAFNQKIGSWDTSNVTGMMGMFMGASSFNQNLNNWDTRKVKSMMHLFNGATVFNNGDVAGGSSIPLNWEIPEVTNMYSAFVARDFNQPFGPKWNTAGVKNMSNMFRQARSFNQYIGDWDTTNVENMAYMFQNANVFNNGAEPGDESKPLNWNTTKVQSMACMFNYATVFNQPFGSNWNTTNVTNMARMFDRASQFNQDISNWDVGKVEYFTQFLNASNMQYYNYDSLLNAWSKQAVLQNRTFGAVGVNYCYAGDARSKLMTTDGWSITDAGQRCPPQNLRIDNYEIDENTTEVGTISSDSERPPITYSLVPGEGSEDNSKFTFNSDTRLLSFSQAPDYEDPQGHGDPENDPDNKNKYTIRVRATDATDLSSEKIFIITVLDVDDSPPEITITPGETMMSNAPITDTTFTVSDYYTIQNVEVDSSSIATASGIACTVESGFSTSDDFPFINDSPGTKLTLNCTITINTSGKLVLKATDDSNLSSTDSADGYVVDEVPPTFITSSVDTETNHNIHNPIVTFQATDAVGMWKYELKYVGSDGKDRVDTIPYADEPDLVTRTLTLNPADDQHTVTVVAYDLAGNTTEISTTFPPDIVFEALTTLSNQAIEDKVTITSPDAEHRIGNFALSGVASEDAYFEDCLEDSYIGSVTCKIKNITKSGMLKVCAQDLDNDAIGCNSQMYTIDTENPTITISAPTKAKNSNITNTTITVTDNIQIDHGDIGIVSNPAGIVQGFACTPTGDPNIITCTVTITDSGSITINATDKAGNSFSKTEEDYIVDRDPPVVRITSDAPINKANQAHYPLAGTCTEGDGDVTINISSQTYQTGCQTGGTWSTELNLSAHPDGVVQVYVSQTDAVGNIGDDTKNLTKDTIVPVADFDTLLTKVKSPKLTGLVNDTTATVQVKVAGKTYDADNNGNGTWKLDAGDIDPELTSGTYTVSVIVTDSALNTETYDFASALTVDATNPVITINPPTKLSNKNIDNIVVTVTDNNGILAEDISINSSSTGGPTNLICTQSGTKKVNCTVMITKSGNLIINAVDEATNSTSQMEDDFVIDRILPVVSITSDTPINNSNKTSYPLAGTCTEGDEDITINIAGQTYQTECQTEGIWSESLDLSALTEGNISIQASQTDAAGNKGTFTKNLLKDTEAPTVTINQSPTQADPTNINSIKYTVVFSEKIKNDTFANADILISGSTTAKVNGITEISDTEYEVEIDNLTDGDTITVIIPADAVTDLAGNGNTESTSDDNSVTYDITQPTVTVNQADDQVDPTNVNEIKFTVVFSEPINGDTFAKDDLEVSGSSTATVAQLQTVSSTTYTAIVTSMLSGETVSLTLPADKVEDLAGNTNKASTYTDKFVTYDATQPTVTVNQADDQVDPTNVNEIKFTVVFSEPINGDTFAKNDLAIEGSSTATVSQLQTVNSTTYTAVVTGMLSGETVSLTLPADKVGDMAGNLNKASTYTDKSVTYDATQPTVTVNQADDQADPTNTDIIKFTIIFSEPIKGDTFTKDDLVKAGSNTAKVLLLTKINDTTYTAYVNGLLSGETVSLSLPANKVEDLAGNKNDVSTFIDNSVTYDNTPPSVTINQSSTQTDPTDINSVKYIVTFSEKINEDTFTKEDILISGSSTAKVKSITKISNTEYEIVIEELTNGDTATVTIPANVLTDLATNMNLASTSTDNSVTYIVATHPEEEATVTPTEEETDIPITPPTEEIIKKSNIPLRITPELTPTIPDTKTTESKTEEDQDSTSVLSTRNLRVRVYDKDDNPIPNITIELHSRVMIATTDQDGYAYFENVEPGLHTMIISYNGYDSIERKINILEDQQETDMEINIRLELQRIPVYTYLLLILNILLTIIVIHVIRKKRKLEKKK
ncbi:MAG: BspA family leucine-rich repeat surface protein [Candidatus Dojkabacteria bacterium]|jgi:surface protein